MNFLNEKPHYNFIYKEDKFTIYNHYGNHYITLSLIFFASTIIIIFIMLVHDSEIYVYVYNSLNEFSEF